MLKLLETRRLPRGTAAAVKELRSSHEAALSWRDVVQVSDDYRNDPCTRFLRLFLPALPVCAEQPAFLLFRDVESHTDDWSRVRNGDRHVAPAFVHWVLYGRAVISVGSKKMAVKRGDVFAMDMNKRHGVESRSLCITACVTVARCTV